MNTKPLLSLTLATLLGSTALAQKPGERPLTQDELLKQIETLVPSSPSAAKNNASPSPLFDTGLGDPVRVGDKKDKAPEKKAKGPTEITALEATFDQKANLAVFIGDVVVKDPEFNVICDKLTAHLKHEVKPKPGAPGAPRPATPAPQPDNASAPKKGGGLERAIAESTSDRRVIITQDKMEADGTITKSIGKSDKATYDAVTGDIVLTGSPDVIQGINRVQATDPGTIMTLNRDGHMNAKGPHKTTIAEKVQ